MRYIMRPCKIKHTYEVYDSLEKKIVVFDEGYQVCANIEHSLNHGAQGFTESDEVAETILKGKYHAR